MSVKMRWKKEAAAEKKVLQKMVTTKQLNKTTVFVFQVFHSVRMK